MTSSIKTTISYTFPSRRKSNKVLIAPLELIMNKFKLQNFQNHEFGKIQPHNDLNPQREKLVKTQKLKKYYKWNKWL